MALRKAVAYSKRKVRPYTRKSSVRIKAYIKAVPFTKLVKFNMGNQADFTKGNHKYIVRMISEEKAQVRDTAIESSRMLINKDLDTEIPGSYYFVIKIFPHHILRDNKTAAGAGADRLSSGMSHSFGTTVGRAALISPGKEIFFVSCLDEKAARVAKRALQKVKAKLPFRNKIMFQKVA